MVERILFQRELVAVVGGGGEGVVRGKGGGVEDCSTTGILTDMICSGVLLVMRAGNSITLSRFAAAACCAASCI